MRDKTGSAVQTYPADRLGEDGADVHDLELSVGLLEVLGLRDRVGDLRRLNCELSGCCAQSQNRGKKGRATHDNLGQRHLGQFLQTLAREKTCGGNKERVRRCISQEDGRPRIATED